MKAQTLELLKQSFQGKKCGNVGRITFLSRKDSLCSSKSELLAEIYLQR